VYHLAILAFEGCQLGGLRQHVPLHTCMLTEQFCCCAGFVTWHVLIYSISPIYLFCCACVHVQCCPKDAERAISYSITQGLHCIVVCFMFNLQGHVGLHAHAPRMIFVAPVLGASAADVYMHACRCRVRGSGSTHSLAPTFTHSHELGEPHSS
jgi:hypothetical protein